jgi:hypothetical protein
MKLDAVVERRLLVNYRTDPAVTARLLPAPFRPQLHNGYAVAGICLIRLGRLRLKGFPPVGLRSENAAHRIAVEWDTPDGVAYGVYIPRRDTNSLANVAAGGRLFPGEHHRARFDVHETPVDVRVGFTGADGAADVDVHVRVCPEWTPSVLFPGIDDASEFFRRGSAGYSATHDPGRLDGIELCTDQWRVEPTEVRHARSGFFADPTRFPPGSAVLDCALLMRGVPVTWNSLPHMRVGGRASRIAAAVIHRPV